MKAVICVLVAVFAIATCDTSDAAYYDRLQNYLEERQMNSKIARQVESVCPGYGSKYEEAIEKVKTCANNLEDENETMCATIKNHFLECSKPVLNMFEECLPERSRQIPDFVFQGMHKVFNYACQTDGEHLLELSNPCFLNINYRTQRCLRRVQTNMQVYKSKTPSKDELCNFLGSMKSCLQSHLTEACGSPITREAFLGIFDSFTTDCSIPKLGLSDNGVDVEVVENFE